MKRFVSVRCMTSALLAAVALAMHASAVPRREPEAAGNRQRKPRRCARAAGLLLRRERRSGETTWARSDGRRGRVCGRLRRRRQGRRAVELGLSDLYDRVAHNLFSINMGGPLTRLPGDVLQAGFMYRGAGLCRAKNAAHTSAMNLMIYPLGCLAFWAYGFAIGWGTGSTARSRQAGLVPRTGHVRAERRPRLGATGTGAFGTASPAPRASSLMSSVGDVSVLALFFFMMVFMDTTATIPTGAMAERWSWKNFCLFGLWVAIPYCVYANWVWGGGWLAQSGLNWGFGHGAVDFAGSGWSTRWAASSASRARSSSGRASASS
ncbi:MAG: ammonium transporter [Deltaproteobacteria bacterium]|nr:ammonium transporter [Deltaproteobacteria bacterium]